MDFLHPGLLAGALLAAVPVVLHLMMRQRPKVLEFPALRFVQARQASNRRTLRLRHSLRRMQGHRNYYQAIQMDRKTYGPAVPQNPVRVCLRHGLWHSGYNN